MVPPDSGAELNACSVPFSSSSTSTGRPPFSLTADRTCARQPPPGARWSTYVPGAVAVVCVVVDVQGAAQRDLRRLPAGGRLAVEVDGEVEGGRALVAPHDADLAAAKRDDAGDVVGGQPGRAVDRKGERRRPA